MSELKPCPFCGSYNVSYCVSELKGDYEQERYITCHICDIKFSYIPCVQDIETWNEFEDPQERELYIRRVITAAWNNRGKANCKNCGTMLVYKDIPRHELDRLCPKCRKSYLEWKRKKMKQLRSG